MNNIDDLCEKLDRLSTAIEQYTLANLDLVKIANQRIDAQLHTYEPPFPYPSGEDAAFVQDRPQVIPAAAVVAQPFQAWQPGNCPKHHLAFVMQPAGVSRAGKPYEAFWKCPYQPGQGEKFCNEKPRGQAA